MSNSPDTPAPSPPALPPVALWPLDVLKRHLVSSDAHARTHALAMALQPGAPINDCIEPLIAAAALNLDDARALPLVAVALGSIDPARATDALRDCLAGLVSGMHPLGVRIFAAHALTRHACMPARAAPEVAMMLLLDDESARKIALHALSPFARQFAAQIAGAVASVTPEKWTSEALAALSKSAKADAAARRTVEAYVMKSLAGQPLKPAGIAGYVALAELNSGGAGLVALGAIVKQATEPEHLEAALNAIGQLGEIARPIARDVADRLLRADSLEQEQLLCRALVQIKAHPGDIPFARVVNRIASAPDENVLPHCMLATLHPKDFAHASVIVKKRFELAEEPLKAALAATYKILTQIDLIGGATAAGSK
ncbi:MAG: hypothetical protein H7203_01425 [Rhizobacter sp.]|nr:hypothetical protein [Burkholderiales bacterium]